MGLPYYVAFFVAILAVYLFFLPIILFKSWQAKSTVGKRFPLMQCDCRKEYTDAIQIIRRRLAAISPVGHGRTEVGFKTSDDLSEYYPAIAFIRLCHYTGYEVVIRPNSSGHTGGDTELNPDQTDRYLRDLYSDYKSGRIRNILG